MVLTIEIVARSPPGWFRRIESGAGHPDSRFGRCRVVRIMAPLLAPSHRDRPPGYSNQSKSAGAEDGRPLPVAYMPINAPVKHMPCLRPISSTEMAPVSAVARTVRDLRSAEATPSS